MKYALLTLALLALPGCAPKATCQVIRLAADACPLVVEIVDEAGQVRRVSLSPEETQEFARVVSAERVGRPASK